MYGLSRPDYIVRCVEVKSGDTVVVEDRAGQQATVRAHGIGAPVEDQPYGRVARRAARKVLKGKRVEVDVTGEDRRGQIVGRVRAGHERLGAILVCRGYAWHDPRQAPKAEVLAELQREARKESRGLWSQDNPVPPWVWARRKRSLGLATGARRLAELMLSLFGGTGGREEPA